MTGLRAALFGLAALAVLAAAPVGALEIEEVTSPGGQDFWLVEEPKVPIVAVEMSFAGGARLDPEGKAGLAYLMTGLLEEGSGELDATAFAARRDSLAADFSFDAGRDAVRVGARMLVETLDASVDLLAAALAEPQFDAAAVERVRGQLLSALAQQESEPASVARRAWYARAFPDHPYGTPSDGTPETVRAITRDDIVAAHARQLTRETARIAVVGDIDAERAGRMIDTLLGRLPDGAPLERGPVEPAPPPGVEVIELGVPQAAAAFGHGGIRRDDPDFMAAYVMNYILGGGGLTSRLTLEVREERGLAYGVYSYLATHDEAGLYLGGVQTVNARMGESIDVIRASWARMAEEGVTAEELDRAKRYLTGAFPLNIDTNGKIADYLVYMQTDELGIDYIDRRDDMIMALTREDVNRAAARLLKPEALSIVVAGRPEGLGGAEESGADAD